MSGKFGRDHDLSLGKLAREEFRFARDMFLAPATIIFEGVSAKISETLRAAHRNSSE